MEEDIKIQSVEAINGGTLIQIDCDKGRLFVDLSQILKALNNHLYEEFDQSMLAMGMEFEDPEKGNPNLLDNKE